MNSIQISSPLSLASGHQVKNRIAKASMTECIANPSTNRVNERVIKLYKQWGETHAGIILTGNIMVDRRYLEAPPNVVVDDERDLDMLKRWAKECQANGSLLVAQLGHPGRQCARSVTWNPIAPSDGEPVKMILPLFSRPRAMTKEEIQETIQMFVRTAKICKKAGFSGVQIHGAHGYLISQFLSPLTNKRTDEYGGSIENRQRFLIEIIRAVRKEVGNEFITAVKMNSADFKRGGFSEEDSMTVIKNLDKEGLDFLEISGGTYENFAPFNKQKSTVEREAHFIEFAKKVKQIKSPKLPLMITGGFRSRDFMQKCLAEGSVDIIGLARPYCIESIETLRGLLDGKTTKLRDIDLEIGEKNFDNGVQNTWHQLQIARISEGLEPDLHMTRFWAVATMPIRRYLWEPQRTPRFTASLVVIAIGVAVATVMNVLKLQK